MLQLCVEKQPFTCTRDASGCEELNTLHVLQPWHALDGAWALYRIITSIKPCTQNWQGRQHPTAVLHRGAVPQHCKESHWCQVLWGRTSMLPNPAGCLAKSICKFAFVHVRHVHKCVTVYLKWIRHLYSTDSVSYSACTVPRAVLASSFLEPKVSLICVSSSHECLVL